MSKHTDSVVFLTLLRWIKCGILLPSLCKASILLIGHNVTETGSQIDLLTHRVNKLRKDLDLIMDDPLGSLVI